MASRWEEIRAEYPDFSDDLFEFLLEEGWRRADEDEDADWLAREFEVKYLCELVKTARNMK